MNGQLAKKIKKLIEEKDERLLAFIKSRHDIVLNEFNHQMVYRCAKKHWSEYQKDFKRKEENK